MSDEKRKKPLWLDMDFGEALQRFIKTDMNELPDRIKLKKRKTAGDKKPPAGKVDTKGDPEPNR